MSEREEDSVGPGGKAEESMRLRKQDKIKMIRLSSDHRMLEIKFEDGKTHFYTGFGLRYYADCDGKLANHACDRPLKK